ncbi:hypothetical protein BGZ74_000910 [Mortierella antarctica]|nr:hypothetical protein BGZ74_000910 [Mortierella antarctica]
MTEHDGWQVDLPEVDTDFKQESTRRSTLYRLALHHLHNAKTLQAQSHFDRTRCLDYKDAFVAFSGIWNTYSSTANEFFGQSLTVEAKTLCYMQSIDDKDQVLMEIMDGLLQKQTLDEILDETYHLQVSQPTYRQLLDVLRIIRLRNRDHASEVRRAIER